MLNLHVWLLPRRRRRGGAARRGREGWRARQQQQRQRSQRQRQQQRGPAQRAQGPSHPHPHRGSLSPPGRPNSSSCCHSPACTIVPGLLLTSEMEKIKYYLSILKCKKRFRCKKIFSLKLENLTIQYSFIYKYSPDCRIFHL